MENVLRHLAFELPSRLIAQSPAHPRESARLLVYERKTGKLTDDYFYNLLNYLPANTVLTLNNSKVDKVRLKFGKREIFLTKTIDSNTAEALVYPGKQFPRGKKLKLADVIEVEVLNVLPDGQRLLRFSCRLDNERLVPYRQTPFPPYIKPNETLADEYQTVYAKRVGSLAAPTAGLHFSSPFLREISRHLNVVEITLHVGLGTFAPLKPENFSSGRLHEEDYELSSQAVEVLNQAPHITAVGTTTLRALESNRHGQFRSGLFETDIFIQPGYTLRAVSALITNFHLPRSSLLLLVAALIGADETRRVYEHAIKKSYRFYSFGDAKLIL